MFKLFKDVYLKGSLIFISLLLVSLPVINSCSQNDSEPLKIGTAVWPGYEPFYLGREKGFINNTEYQMVEFLSASQVMQSFRNKVLDVAALTMDEVLVLVDEGFQPVVILVLDSSNGADAIVSKDIYRSVAGLKGKKIGYESGALGAFVLSRALSKSSMTHKDIVLVTMNVNETEYALTSGSVDAVVTFEPVRSRLLEAGYKDVFNSKEIPNEIVDVLIVRKELLNNKRSELKKLVKGWFRSLDYYNANRLESYDVMNSRLQLSKQGLKAAFDGIVFPDKRKNIIMLSSKKETGSLLKVTEQLVQEMTGKKLLNKKVSLDGLFDSSIVNNGKIR